MSKLKKIGQRRLCVPATLKVSLRLSKLHGTLSKSWMKASVSSSRLLIHPTFKVLYSVPVVERVHKSSAFAYSMVPYRLYQILLLLSLMCVR